MFVYPIDIIVLQSGMKHCQLGTHMFCLPFETKVLIMNINQTIIGVFQKSVTRLFQSLTRSHWCQLHSSKTKYIILKLSSLCSESLRFVSQALEQDSSMVLNVWMFRFSFSMVETAKKNRFHCDGLRAAFDSGRDGTVLQATTANGRAARTTEWRWLSMDNKIQARKNSK